MPAYHKCQPYDLVLPDGSTVKVEVEISEYTPVEKGRIMSDKTEWKVENIKIIPKLTLNKDMTISGDLGEKIELNQDMTSTRKK
jgi:hypothetical protein